MLKRIIHLNRTQRSLLASHLANPNKGHQNAALVVRIGGKVDPRKLKQAFGKVVMASDALRTLIKGSNDTQVAISDVVPVPTEVVEQDQEEFEIWAKSRAAHAMDLAQGCYDSRIARHKDDSVSWFINIHHIINDAYSAKTVLQKVEEAYEGGAIYVPSYYQENPFENAAVANKTIAYWQDLPPTEKLERLYDHTFQGDGSALNITLKGVSPQVQNALKQDYKLLTPMLSETVFWAFCCAAYLYRISEAEEFTIGMTVSHQAHKEFRDSIGPMFEIFPVPISVPSDATFQSLHAEVAKSVMTTLGHAHVGSAPTTEMSAVVNIIPSSAMLESFLGHPVSISYLQSGAIDPAHALRFHVSPYAADVDTPGPTLSLDIARDAAGSCNPDKIKGHYERLIELAATNPNAVIKDVDILSSDEHDKLANWSKPTTKPKSLILVDRLRSTLADNSKIVLTEDDKQLSGADLWLWAQAVATYLEQSNAPVRVGVELRPSISAVVAIFGVAISGRSFVPIATDLPDERRAVIVRQAKLELIFDDPAMIERLKDGPVLTLPTPQQDAEAYVLFTSGSTGTPRGVPITFQGLEAYLTHALSNYFKHVEHPVVPLFGSLGFDLTLTSLFAPILAGGEIIAFPDHPAVAMWQIAAEGRINWMKATPSHLDLFLRSLAGTHGLRTVIVGGEAFATSLAHAMIDRSGNKTIQLLNEYGPTETVVGCMLHEVTNDDLKNTSTIPIGCAISGVGLKIMDGFGHPVSLGALGELWITHDTIFAHYLDHSPAASGINIHDQHKYYQSGDLVQINDDGVMFYQGRIDEQLKIGGVRIDPVEIETALMSHPEIEQAVVRSWHPTNAQIKASCVRCGLPDTVPDHGINDASVCKTCIDYDKIRDQAQIWFRSPDELQDILTSAGRHTKTTQPVMHLLSGGKDSTYALYRLVDMGCRPYVVTLDNGFVSEGAKDNIDRVIAHLGLEHEYLTTPSMNEIFRDSLTRYSNVCNGCYKTIYTLATNRANELGIPVIITGLSRGQLFETRLAPQQFSNASFDSSEIDRAVLAARKRYHRADDVISQLLDTSAFEDDKLFENIAYVDFYRYVDVPISEVIDYLTHKTDWKRPTDTGRSTNCLVNETGIHTHIAERGFHNYAIPYAWDVRLGHKTRAEAMEELNDVFDLPRISDQLEQIGYKPNDRSILTAWFIPRKDRSDTTPSSSDLRSFLADILPAHAIPQSFTPVASITLTANGKVDFTTLPVPARTVQPRVDVLAQAVTPLQETIVTEWERILGQSPIGLDDDFFVLGGDSLLAINMVFQLQNKLDRHISDSFAFQFTTPRSLAEVLDNLTAVASSKPDLGEISALDNTEIAPEMTALEEAIFLDQKTRPDALHYNVGRIFYLPASVSSEHLVNAIQKFAARTKPLFWSYGSTRHRLDENHLVEITTETLTCRREDLEESHANLLVKAFDLKNGPLLRAAIQPLNDGEIALLVMAHHVTCDHASFNVLMQEVATYIETGAFSGDAPDHASVFCEAFPDNDPESNLFWSDRIFTTPSPLRTQSLCNTSPQGKYLEWPVSLPVATSNSGTTMAARALAAAATAISPFLEGQTVDLGLVTGRETEIGSRVFGGLINTVPIELSIKPRDTIQKFTKTIQQTMGEVLANRKAPLTKIVELQRAAGKNFSVPRFLVSVVEPGKAKLGSHMISDGHLHAGGAVRPITLFVVTSPNDLRLGIEYDRGMISDVVAAQVSDMFTAAFLAASNRAPRTLETLTQDVSKPSKVIAKPLNDKTPILAQILSAATRDPSALAIVSTSVDWNWNALIAHAEAISAQLHERGIQPADRIAIALERGPLYLAAILASMGHGVGYVPLDIGYPDSQISRTLSEAKPRLVLRHTGDGMIITDAGIDGIPWDELSRTPLQQQDPETVAYTMFTSGSTGTPLGVPITHGQLAHSTNARVQTYTHSPRRFALLSSLAFDSSVVGVFWTLATGGTIVIPDKNEMRDPKFLSTLLATGADTVLLVPTLYDVLLDLAMSEKWPDTVILAGEACPTSVAEKHFSLFKASTLTNEYGPTEGTVWALYHHISPTNKAIPIGLPVPECWAAVVDETGMILPAGVKGELVIGGPQITKGYIGGKAQDAKRFTRPNGTTLPEGPLFFTGDKAVFNGEHFEFLGRADDQINIGGIRLSPIPLETELMKQSGVQTAVVVAFDKHNEEGTTVADDISSDAVMVAHLETSKQGLDAQLREAMAHNFPIGQRPAHYVYHNQFPRLPNGKIDRRKLTSMAPRPLSKPLKSYNDTDAQEFSIKPHADLETLVLLCCETLNSTTFNANDNFFEHGGYSLVALRLLLKIEDVFQVTLSTATIYEEPTPRGFYAKYLANSDSNTSLVNKSVLGPKPFVVPYNSKGTGAAFFAIHSLEKNGALFRGFAKNLSTEHPFYGVGESGAVSLNSNWVSNSDGPTEVADQAAIYVEEILNLKPSGPLVITGSCLGALYAYEVAQQLSARGRQPDLLLLLHDLHAPYIGTRELHRREMWFRKRLSQLHKNGLRSIPRFIQKLPALASRSKANLTRQIEILYLKRAKANGKELSKRMRDRDFVERSYLSSKQYTYEPYAGRTLIVRDPDNTFYDPESPTSGWDSLLPDSNYYFVQTKGFNSMFQEPVIGKVVAQVEGELSNVKANNSHAVTAPRIQAGFKHKITLDITDDNFVAAPRSAQRDWLLRQRLRELSQDLDHLDGEAHNMVAATGAIEMNDRAHIELSPDEIMEDWQIPLMKRMAEVIAGPGGHILEIGFGRGILSDFVQSHNVQSHTIVECNPHVIADFHKWKACQGDRDIRLIEGRWEDVAEQFGLYDGILFHTYPLDEEELIEALATTTTFAETFFATASKSLKLGGRFTYFTNEADSLSRGHQRALLDHFGRFSISSLNDLNIPDHTADAHWYNTITVVEAIKTVLTE